MKKRFDCVEMKRQGALRVYEKTKGMTVEEEVAFWKEQTAALMKRRRAARKRPGAKGRRAPPTPSRSR